MSVEDVAMGGNSTSDRSAAPPIETDIRRTDMRARGEPALWILGGALAQGFGEIHGVRLPGCEP